MEDAIMGKNRGNPAENANNFSPYPHEPADLNIL